MNATQVKSRGRIEGYFAARYCVITKQDRRECECEHPHVCASCIRNAAHESEANSRQFSPFELFASEVNKATNSEQLWEVYETGVTVGIEQGITKRLGQ